MGTYLLYFSGSQIELAGAKEAVQLSLQIQQLRETGQHGKLVVKTPSGIVHLFAGPTTELAITIS
jgi:hypothetical protein